MSCLALRHYRGLLEVLANSARRSVGARWLGRRESYPCGNLRGGGISQKRVEDVPLNRPD